MKNRIYKLSIILNLVGSLVFITSCEKEKVYPPESEMVDELYSLMNQWYLWKDSIADIEPDNYQNPDELLEAMRYQARDKWSYITTEEEHNQYFEEGKYVGYGFSYGPDSEGNIRITFIFSSRFREIL